MKKITLAVSLLVLLASGCEEISGVPKTNSVCIKSHQETIQDNTLTCFHVGYITQCDIPKPRIETVCDEYQYSDPNLPVHKTNPN